MTYVAKGKEIPPFLILHVADRQDSGQQSNAFSKALREADVEASVVAAEGKDHGSINRDLGLPDDKPTIAMFEFLERALSRD
jgi:acetyl esterase/lipase